MGMRVELGGLPNKTSQRWLQDYSDRKVLLPGGVTLDAAQFTADASGRKIVLSGTVIGKLDAEAKYGPVDVGDSEVFILWRDIDITADGELAEAVRSGLLIEKFMPIMTAPVKALLRINGFQFLDYGTGVDE